MNKSSLEQRAKEATRGLFEKKYEPERRTEPEQRTEQETKKKDSRVYIYCDEDIKEFIRFKTWKDKKQSINKYVIDLIKKDMEEYIKAGGKKEDWEN